MTNITDRLSCSSLTGLLATGVALVLATGCPPGPAVTTALTDSESDSDDSQGGPTTTTMDPTTVTPTTLEPSTTEEPTTTAGPDPICGDGNVDAELDEECDEGENNDNNGSCTEDCKNARCGDGFIQDGEVCDDGDEGNDDAAYEGCTTQCQLGPRCGDGELQEENEECDSDDITTGCLSTCKMALSCNEIIGDAPDASTGSYMIHPVGAPEPFTAWCDMEADGGGYTFLKYDVQGVMNDQALDQAQNMCQAYGLYVLIPRTEAHLAAAWNFATNENLPPVGGGMVAADEYYLTILNILPTELGQSCVGMALNDVDCPEWMAADSLDNSPYWVSSEPKNIGQPSANNYPGSMEYVWNPDGTVKEYTVVSGSGFGARSFRWICHAQDKVEGL